MRYIRQTIFDRIGDEGQKRLRSGSILIVGCGALGCMTSNLLTRAGIGKITIVDRDFVELHNLQRQTLFSEKDVGKLKALAAQERLEEINSDIVIRGVCEDINQTTILSFLEGVTLVCDCTDNLQTRFLINDACVKLNIPWIYAGAVASYGATMNIIPGKTPCFQCLFPKPPDARLLPTCDTVGILNSIPAIISSIQVTETLKILLGKEPRTSLLMYDVWDSDFNLIEVKRNEDCPVCVRRKFPNLEAKNKEFIAVLCGRNAVQINPSIQRDIDFFELEKKLKKAGDVTLTPYLLTFSSEGYQIHLFKNGRCIIKGTDDEKTARSLYARFVGA